MRRLKTPLHDYKTMRLSQHWYIAYLSTSSLPCLYRNIKLTIPKLRSFPGRCQDFPGPEGSAWGRQVPPRLPLVQAHRLFRVRVLFAARWPNQGVHCLRPRVRWAYRQPRQGHRERRGGWWRCRPLRLWRRGGGCWARPCPWGAPQGVRRKEGWQDEARRQVDCHHGHQALG